jgi:hypothetical protein
VLGQPCSPPSNITRRRGASPRGAPPPCREPASGSRASRRLPARIRIGVFFASFSGQRHGGARVQRLFPLPG